MCWYSYRNRLYNLNKFQEIGRIDNTSIILAPPRPGVPIRWDFETAEECYEVYGKIIRAVKAY